MKRISRFLVAFLMMFFTQSSLGTKAELVNSKNLGQNGYKKYEDGMLIQWAYVINSGSNRIVYFPQTFIDTNYSIVTSFFIDETLDSTTYCLQIKYRGPSYFRATSVQNTSDVDRGITERPYFYIVIGRWK